MVKKAAWSKDLKGGREQTSHAGGVLVYIKNIFFGMAENTTCKIKDIKDKLEKKIFVTYHR